MPFASALCPISGFSVVVIPASSPGASGPGTCVSLSQVVAEDEIGHAARLVLPLHVVGEPVDGLGAAAARAVDRLDLGDLHVDADATADTQGGREADPVEAVVQDDVEALDGAHLPQQAGRHAEGQEAVLHGGAERAGLRALRIHMDPLLVTRQRRERVDVLLPDGPPAADTDLRADA